MTLNDYTLVQKLEQAENEGLEKGRNTEENLQVIFTPMFPIMTAYPNQIAKNLCQINLEYFENHILSAQIYQILYETSHRGLTGIARTIIEELLSLSERRRYKAAKEAMRK